MEGQVVVRPLPADGERIVQEVFEGLTEEQRRTRFHVAVPRLTAGMLRHLGRPDGEQHVALVAEVLGRPVGIARYHRTAADRAEIAVEVVSEHTRRGIGRLLLQRLAATAARNGVTELHFLVLADNRAALRLAADVAVALEPVEGGCYLGRVVLGTGEVMAGRAA